MREEYRADLRKARDVLRDLLERMEQLEVQIARQRRKVAALAVLGEQSGKGDDVTTELRLDGLTSACRSALRAAGRRGLTPIELRASLRQLNFPIDVYQNSLAVIHTILKRLESYKEVRAAIHDVHDGRDDSVYQWIGPQFGASRSLANLYADAERDKIRRKEKRGDVWARQTIEASRHTKE